MALNPIYTTPPLKENTRLAVVAFAAQQFDPVHRCQKCNHIGYVFEEDLSEFAEGGWYSRTPCTCNTDSIRDHAAMREAGVPSTFVSASLDTWQNVGRTATERVANDRAIGIARQVCDRLDEASNDGLNLWIYGSQGAGKTWVACAILREAILAHGYTGRFFPSTEIIRCAIHDGPAFGLLYDVGWLVLDGIDRMPHTQSGFENSALFALLSHRIQHKAPTIFTAHCPMANVHSLFGDPVGKDLANLLPSVTVQLALVGGDFSQSKGIRLKWDP